MIDFEFVLSKIGGFGRYQILLSVLVWFSSLPNGYITISPVFINYVPNYRCEVSKINDCSQGWNETSVLDLITTKSGNEYIYCERYKYHNDTDDCSNCSTACFDNATVPCDEGFYYGRSIFAETVVTEFNLVCDDAFWNSLATSIFMVGALTGAVMGGFISDRWGRKTSSVIFAITTFLPTLGCAFVHQFWLFVVCRFFMSLCSLSLYICTFTYNLEITATKWRTVVGVGFQVGYATGYMALSGIAYYWNNWHHTMLAMAIIMAPLCILFPFIPESPRWLFANENDERGKEITRTFAKYNGVNIDESTLWIKAEKAAENAAKDEIVDKRKYSYIDLFRTPNLRIITVLVTFTWFCCGLVYFGISFNVDSLSGDIFINNTISGVVEVCAYLIVILIMDITGRKYLLIFLLVFSGTFLICSTLVREFSNGNQSLDTLSTVFGLGGKGGIAGAYAIMYNFTSEMIPTVVRSNALAIGTISAAIGSVITPYVILLQDTVAWLPNVVFGVVTILTALLAVRFPETKSIDMMQTIQDAELFYSGKCATNGSPESRQQGGSYDNEAYEDEGTKL